MQYRHGVQMQNCRPIGVDFTRQGLGLGKNSLRVHFASNSHDQLRIRHARYDNASLYLSCCFTLCIICSSCVMQTTKFWCHTEVWDFSLRERINSPNILAVENAAIPPNKLTFNCHRGSEGQRAPFGQIVKQAATVTAVNERWFSALWTCRFINAN